MSYCVSIDDVLPMVVTGEGEQDSRTVRGGIGCSGGIWNLIGRYKMSASATTSVSSETRSWLERVRLVTKARGQNIFIIF